MKVCLFSDFDGPLMDVSERYFQVYCFILPQAAEPGQPLNYLSKAEFWECKRAQVNERTIGRQSGLTEEQAEQFVRLRRRHVHADPFFAHDRVQPDVYHHLTRLQAADVDLTVVTMRRTRELEPTLEQFDLARFFPSESRYCLANDYHKSNDVHDKQLLLARHYPKHQHQRCYMVGDTEADILAAKHLGIPSLGVLCGIRNEARLRALDPWKIVANLGEAADLILHDAG
ncbi:HAD family hydrolase [Candidatus Cyanaurora vandensis]|uniref:HAD family hydrolase n=1 Tax=Candidatus Cyanaurora vandensis TaxID=2714958 RepID=UPI00257C70AA|nr:HAD family hydrolase [Candidatus Cyanaurora vandensis]